MYALCVCRRSAGLLAPLKTQRTAGVEHRLHKEGRERQPVHGPHHSAGSLSLLHAALLLLSPAVAVRDTDANLNLNFTANVSLNSIYNHTKLNIE